MANSMAITFALNEISQTLENFNQLQCSNEERLEPVDKWSSDIVEKLDLKEDRDFLSVDPEEALQRILPVAENESQKKALSQFFFQHLSELKCHICKDEIECIISEFAEGHPTNEQLTRLVEIFKKLQSVLNDSEKFEKCIGELRNLHQLQKAFADINEAGNESADSEILIELANELLNLSPVMFPIPKGVLQIIRDANLLEFAFNKISLSKITEICQIDDGLSTEFSALERLRLLAVCDSRARYAVRRSPTVMDDSDEEESSEPLHPMDVLYASFLCCDVEAKQFLCQRLFACKLAFPFLYVNEFDHLVQSDWALADIVVEFEDSRGEMLRICLGASSIMQLEASHKPQVPRLPVVSFLRIGELKVSKSKILSNLLGSSQEDTFFNRDCTQERVKRICSSGLIEAAVSFKIPHSPYLALNLRGNAMDEPCDRQTDKLARMSDCCLLFGGIDEFAKHETKKFVEKLSKDTKTMLIIALEPTRKTEKKLAAQTFNSLQFKKVLAYRDSLSVRDIVLKVQSKLNEIIGHDLQPHGPQSTSTYEDSSKAALIWAQKLYQPLANEKFSRAKILPVQSLAASRAGENVKKGYFRRLGEFLSNEANPESISAARQQLYQSQVSVYNERRSACLENFRDWLYHLQENEASASVKTYLHAVNLILDEHSFNTLPKLKEQLSLAKSKLAALENQADLQGKRKDLEDDVKKAEKNLTDSSIDLNSLFRELGLVFEAHSNMNNSDFPERLNKLPCAFASLLLSGVPLELLDGTAANISMDWISTVLLECKRQVGDKKLFFVSVLGTQSTGKSTLLNTMFGLRLPVSAGRCTRGAFLQLVRVDESSRLPFHYLAVIDTEGLRAVELGIDNHFNDNAFATLVIGLADVTLITVNGEDSAEMREVLPIVIQAFIQMNQVNKDLNLKRQCIFAHQNLGDPVAHAKLQNDFPARQAKLDKLTEEAARTAGLSGVKFFSDIISFSPETDIFLLPRLWHGNPPSAPVNIEFSEQVCKLKQHLIKLSTETPLLSFQDFACRIDDVLSAVLTQDFVLSFRNSIESKAFNDLETEFKEIVLEFKKTAKCYVNNLLTSRKKHVQSQHDFDCLKLELDSMVEAAFKEAEDKLNKYFQESERHQYMAFWRHGVNQWQSSRMAELSKVKEELQQELLEDLNEFVKVQELEFRHNEVVEKARNILAKSALKLAKQSERHPLSDGQIEKHFEGLWNSEIVVIYQDSVASVDFIEQKLKSYAAEQFPQNTDIQNFIFTSEISKPVAEIETIKILYDVVQFQSTDDLYDVRGIRRYIDRDRYHNSVLEAVKSVLTSIRQFLTEISEKNRSFWDSDAQKVIKKVRCELDRVSDSLSCKKVSLTQKMKAAVAVYACRMAYGTFKQMEIQFSKQHSLKSRLDAEKMQMLQLFRGRVQKVQHATMAADEIINALKKVLSQLLEKKMDSLVPSKCLEHFKTSLCNKTRLIKKLLQHAMDSSDQKLILSYISSPTEAAFDFLKMQVEEFLFETEVDDSLPYILIAKAEFLEPSKRAIHNALGLAERCTSLEDWLRKFCGTLSIPNDALDMSILLSPEVAFQDVKKSLTQKAPMVIDGIFDKLREKVERGRNCKNYDLVPGMKRAYREVKSYLWGCQHCCPLCNEPCMRMEADHVNGDKNLHRCICHRPMGLTGDKLESASELAPYSCGYFATPFSGGPFATIVQGFKNMRFKCRNCSMETQIQTPEEEADSEAGIGAAAITKAERTLHKCSDYKNCFPDWVIKPTVLAPVPDFWKWIAWNHREALLSTSNVYAAIPEKWKEVTLAKARQSLDKVFAE